MEDYELIENFLKGDMDAFGLIVKKYQTSLLSLSWNILRDLEEAKDSVQETFLQILQNLNKFDRKKEFKNWLFSIAYKRAIDRRRKITFIIKKLGELGKNQKEGIKEENQEIWDLLQKLNQKERTAVLLQTLEGFSAKEIGEVIGCAENTVRVHIFNARKKLRKLLKEGLK